MYDPVVFIKILLEVLGLFSLCCMIILYGIILAEKRLREGKTKTHPPNFKEYMPVPSAKDLEEMEKKKRE